MSFDHDTLVAFAKSGGLFYFIAFSIGVLIYTFWPKNRKKFDRAKRDILEHEDRPALDDEQKEPREDQQPGRTRKDETWR